MAWISPTESAKNMLFLAYLVCALVFNMGYQAYLTFNGRMGEWSCREEALNQWNQDVIDIERETDVDLGGTITYDQCVEQSANWIWADFAIKVLGTVYFTYVIMRWTKYSDGYMKA